LCACIAAGSARATECTCADLVCMSARQEHALVTDLGRSELSNALRQELARRLTEAGWDTDVAYDAGPEALFLGAFRRPIVGEFWITVQFIPMNLRAREDTLAVMGVVGVSYFPAYCLWPTLIDVERSDLTVAVGELDGSSERIINLKLAGSDDVPKAVEALVAPVLAHGMGWARQYTSIDAVIECYRVDPERFDGEIQVIPVLLATSGRPIEARNALSNYLASGREETTTPQFRRFSHAFSGWLDAGAVTPEPPTGPVGPRIRRPEEPTREDQARRLRVRREAEEAVRHNRDGKTRDQLREMLTAELVRREVKEGPFAIEMMLDRILVSENPISRARSTLSGLKAAAALVTGVVKLLRDPETKEQPEWLEPPPRATHQIWADHRNAVGVELDPAAETWLDRVLNEAAAIIGDMTTVKAWLTWDPEPQEPSSRLAVHIGAARVGVIPEADVRLFQTAMDSASRSDGVPFTPAALHRRKSSPRYVLEVWAPQEG
jgi:hypothetical protein